MDMQLENGDYVPGPGGALQRVQGDQALLQRARFRLQAQRGAFAYDPAFGSELYRLTPELPGADQAALALARQALAPLAQVRATAAHVTQTGASVSLEIHGQTYTVEVSR